MPVRMRLQRFGKKGKPFYHVVVADGRAPRDGKFIEKIGTYNPLTQSKRQLISDGLNILGIFDDRFPDFCLPAGGPHH